MASMAASGESDAFAPVEMQERIQSARDATKRCTPNLLGILRIEGKMEARDVSAHLCEEWLKERGL